MDELVECPHCLGEGEVYNDDIDDTITCHLCNGKGKVTLKVADIYIESLVDEEDFR